MGKQTIEAKIETIITNIAKFPELTSSELKVTHNAINKVLTDIEDHNSQLSDSTIEEYRTTATDAQERLKALSKGSYIADILTADKENDDKDNRDMKYSLYEKGKGLVDYPLPWSKRGRVTIYYPEE